jgi:hypothetical protein
VLTVAARVLHAPSFRGSLPLCFTAGDFFFGFSAFVLCIPLVSIYSLPMFGSKFIRIFIVEGLNVIIVRFVILPRQLFFKSDPSNLECEGVCPSFLNLYAFGLFSING